MATAPAASGSGTMLLVVAGDRFFSVNAGSLQIAAKATLPRSRVPSLHKTRNPATPTAANASEAYGRSRPADVPPGSWSGRTLYVMNAGQIVAVNIDDGSHPGEGRPAETTGPASAGSSAG